MGIPSVAEMEALVGKKKRSVRGRTAKARAAKFRTLYDDDAEPTRYDVSLPEEKAAYEEARDLGARTAVELKRGGAATSGFTGALAKSLGGDIGKAFTGKGKRGTAVAKRAGARVGVAVKSAVGKDGGLKLLSKALPIAARLAPVAMAVGALWYLSKRAEDQKLATLVAEYAAAQEAYYRRPMTTAELETFLPIWRDQAWSRLTKARAGAPNTYKGR